VTPDPAVALDLFERARDLEQESQEQFLRGLCGADQALFERVTGMLRADAASHALLDYSPGPPPRPALARLEGRHLGPYRLVRELGRGGMGIVYLAQRDDVGSKVALKLITSHNASAEGIARFHYERRILASLEHPYIARFLDAGIAEDETPWLAMEYVEGQALDAWRAAHEPTAGQRVALFEKVCEAVAYVHRNLLVHRDLKPSNILVNAAGEPRLVDFGIAKLLADEVPGRRTVAEAAGRPMTPEYASPEQIRGDRITPASDVFQLGRVFAELLKDGRSGGDIANIIAKALDPEPERRYASADQLREDVRAHRAGRPIVARPGSLAYRARKFVRRHKAAVATLVTVNILIIVAAFVFAAQARRIALERDRAEQVSALMERMLRIADPTGAGRDTGKAREVLSEAASEAREGLKRDPATWARIMFTVGRVYRNADQYDTALAILREAAAAVHGRLPPDNPTLLNVLGEYGVTLLESGQVDSGIALLEQVATHSRGLDPRRRAELASHLVDLGYGRQVAGQDERAVELYREAAAMLETLPDSGGNDYDRILINSGFVHERRGNDSLAADKFRLTLGRRMRRLGPEAGPTLNAMNSFARAQYRMGNLDEAERWADSALGIRRRMLPDPHQNTAESLLLTSQIHAARGHLLVADSLGRVALDIYGRLPKALPMSVAWALGNQASIAGRRGNYAEAAKLQRQSIAKYLEVVGDRHPSTLIVMSSLAESEARLGNTNVALDIIARAVPPLDSIFGDVATLAGPLTTWGIVLTVLGRCEEARPHLTRALRLARARWADTTESVTTPEHWLRQCGGASK
jgi:tetratricopeptide (TPR) repeat protein